MREQRDNVGLDGVVDEVADAYRREISGHRRGAVDQSIDAEKFAQRTVEILDRCAREGRVLSDTELASVRSIDRDLKALRFSSPDLVRLHYLAPRILQRYLVNAQRGRTITEVTATLLAITSQIIADVFSDRIAVPPVAEASMDRGLVGWLLSDNPDYQRSLTERAREIEFVPGPAHAVVAIGTTRQGSSAPVPEPLANALCEALTKKLSEAGYRPAAAAHDGRVVAIVPVVKLGPRDVAEAVGSLLRSVSLPRATRTFAGIGGPRTKLGALKDAYADALHTLELVREVDGLGDVMTYEDALPYLLLRSEPRRALDLARIVEPLAARDAEGQSKLMETIGALIAAAGSLSQTAKDLNVHRHTLYARISRITELTGKRVDDPDDRLLLHLALCATRLLSGAGGGPVQLSDRR